MKTMIETLKRIGVPAEEIQRIIEYYGEDIDGLQHYVRYMQAILDDRHEYI